MAERCKVCRTAALMNSPYLFFKGWWYCSLHMPQTDKGVTRNAETRGGFIQMTRFVIDLPDGASGVVGPFDSREAANTYADSTLGEVRWEVRELFSPAPFGDHSHGWPALGDLEAADRRCSCPCINCSNQAHWMCHGEGVEIDTRQT